MILAVVGLSTQNCLFQQVLCASLLKIFLDSVGIDVAFDFTDEAGFMLFRLHTAFWWNTNS